MKYITGFTVKANSYGTLITYDKNYITLYGTGGSTSGTIQPAMFSNAFDITEFKKLIVEVESMTGSNCDIGFSNTWLHGSGNEHAISTGINIIDISNYSGSYQLWISGRVNFSGTIKISKISLQ